MTNRLTGSAELVENALFATLDTAVRRARAKDGRLYAYVDTVGFVRRLPTQLIEAFKSTLEEVGEADLILHVVDGSHPDPFSQIDAVNEVLSDIEGVGNIPVVIAFNKADMMDEAARERIAALAPEAHIVSAATGEGIEALRTQVESMLPTPFPRFCRIRPVRCCPASGSTARSRAWNTAVTASCLRPRSTACWPRRSWSSRSADVRPHGWGCSLCVGTYRLCP